MRPQRGLDLAAQHHPDLVLVDLDLPDRPGEEVLRRRRAGVAVVVPSADARPGLVGRLLEEGARAFLTKPWTPRNRSTCSTPSPANGSGQAPRRSAPSAVGP